MTMVATRAPSPARNKATDMPDDIVVRYVWDRSKIAVGLATILGALIILSIWAVMIRTGLMVPKADYAPYVLLGGGLALCAFFTAIFIRMMFGDAFLTIYSSGKIVIKPIFRERVTQLISGSEIEYDNRTVTLVSGSTTEKIFERHGGADSIRLPNALKPVVEGRFRAT